MKKTILDIMEEIYTGKIKADSEVLKPNPVIPNPNNEEKITVNFEELQATDHITLERLRMVTKGYVPCYEVSYVHAIVNGKRAEILNFPSQIPKKYPKRYLVEECQNQGVFIADLCDTTKWSISR